MNTRSFFIVSALMILGAGSLMAKPAMRGLRTVSQPDGTSLQIRVSGDEHFHLTTTPDGYILRKDDDGFYRLASLLPDGSLVSTGLLPDAALSSVEAVNISDIDFNAIRSSSISRRLAPQSGMGLSQDSYPVIGSPRALVILVEYSDVKFHAADNYDAADYFNDMINGADFRQFGGTGSALEYFREQSGGKFLPQFDVYGPVTLPNKQAYYGRNNRYGDDANAQFMVTHAIDILDDEVDFSIYDTDGDGVIDNVYIFYAGQGEADWGDEESVWPHAYDVRFTGINKKVDGVVIGHYACSNEWSENTPDGVGPFLHEFSHVMGLPDLYHTLDADANYTPDSYDLLDYGSYNNDSRTPPNYSAYEKNAMRWFEPIVVQEASSVTLHPISSGEFILIPTSRQEEFFLFENRQQSGWDEFIPGHGLLIWHIDYVKNVFDNNIVNNMKSHQYVDIVEANGRQDFRFAEGYTFPGTANNTSFTASTVPAFQDWSGKAVDLPVTDITEKDGVITFDVAGGGPQASVGITPEDSSPVEFFNLQGVRISNPQPGTLVIVCGPSGSRKFIFR